MNRRFQKNIHPVAGAVLVLIVLVIVQLVWWRGLVYRPPSPNPGPGGGGGSNIPNEITINGRADVFVDTLSGNSAPGDADGPGHASRFDRPTGLALDAQGNVYVADSGNHRIRKISPDGTTMTQAGSAEGYADGPAAQARFNSPCGICVAPDGAVYVADTGNNCIRRILNEQVTTVIAKPSADAQNTPPGGQKLNLPTGIAYLPEPVPALLVTDSGDKKLRRYRLDGTLESEQTLPGPPTAVAAIYGTRRNEISREGARVARVGIAIPPSGSLILSSATLRNLPVEDEYGSSNPKGPFLHHPVALWPLRDNWLVTDNDHGAVFLIRNGKAEVLAGYASTGGPIRGDRDSEGSKAEFSALCGIVADGKKFVYVADTGNNCIRRLTLSEYVGY